MGIWTSPGFADLNIGDRLTSLSTATYAGVILAAAMILCAATALVAIRRRAEARQRSEEWDRCYEARLLLETLRVLSVADSSAAEKPQIQEDTVIAPAHPAARKLSRLLDMLNAEEEGLTDSAAAPIEPVAQQRLSIVRRS